MKMSVGVVIPAYKVRNHILDIISRIGQEVTSIIVIDDKCPDGSGQFVLDNCRDPRVVVCFHEQNKGVGGAVITGYRSAIERNLDIVVKVDGDGQMPPEMIETIIAPILSGEADYVKGNRFFNPEDVRAMPHIRLVGNAALSFLTKMSSGYWSVFDPTNGFTAIHASLLPVLGLNKIAERYFFETDMLFRLSLIRGRVIDVPMTALYGDEESNLKIRNVFLEFLLGNIRNAFKRIFYSYFLRNFSIASAYLVVGLCLMFFGLVFGSVNWAHSVRTGVAASSGTVMLAAMPLLIGLQLLLNFMAFDVSAEPSSPIHPRLTRLKRSGRIVVASSASQI
jgi:glycosyltransferase involved in cell wall biosynthesis